MIINNNITLMIFYVLMSYSEKMLSCLSNRSYFLYFFEISIIEELGLLNIRVVFFQHPDEY